MHPRSQVFFAARKRCWSLSAAYSKSTAPKHSSAAAVARRNFKVMFKPRPLFPNQLHAIANVPKALRKAASDGSDIIHRAEADHAARRAVLPKP